MRTALAEWPAEDMVALIKKLPPGSQLAREEMGDMADWGHMPENLARLVDLMTAWLNYEYQSWIADPDEVEAERKRRKRMKVQPPPRPLIQPVASRPLSLHEKYMDEYSAEAVAWNISDIGEPGLVSTDEFDAILGL